MWRLAFRIGRWIFGILDIVAQASGGWTVFSSSVVAVLTAAWGIFVELGPLAVPIGLLAMAIGLIAFEELGNQVERFRRASARRIEIMRQLHELTERGKQLISRTRSPQDLSARWKPAPSQNEWRAWYSDCLRVVRQIDMQEYYGLNSIDQPVPFYDKLRFIGMRYAERYRFRVEDIEGSS